MHSWKWKGLKSRSAQYDDFLWTSVLPELVQLSGVIAVNGAQKKPAPQDGRVRAESVWEVLSRDKTIRRASYMDESNPMQKFLHLVAPHVGRVITRHEGATFTHNDRFAYASLSKYPEELLFFSQVSKFLEPLQSRFTEEQKRRVKEEIEKNKKGLLVDGELKQVNLAAVLKNMELVLRLLEIIIDKLKKDSL